MDITISNIEKANIFSSIFKLLHQLNKDVNLQFSKDGLYIQTMDSNHICLSELKMHSTWFDSYKIKPKNETFNIGINLDIMSKILKCKDSNQTIKLHFDKKREYLDMTFGFSETSENDDTKQKKMRIEKEFELPLMDIDSDILDIPESEYQADFSLESTVFQHISNEMNMFSETLEFNVNEEKINFVTKGEYGNYTINLDIDDLDEFSIEEDKVLKLNYNLKYFTMVSQFNKLSKNIQLSISDNMPLKMMYQFDNDNEINNIVFYLAPKIDDDDL